METKDKNQRRTTSASKRPAASASRKKQTAQPAGQRTKTAKTATQTAKTARPKSAPQESVRVTPEVVYLAPKPFSRNRLVLHLVTVVAVVIALMLGLSVFFKVENIQVSGCEKYTAWDVQQASGVNVGDQLLTLSREKAAGKIIAQLNYVKSVRIGITLPDTVNIEITELAVTYAAESLDGSWWLISADGKVVAQIGDSEKDKFTQILGVKLLNPVAGEVAEAYQTPAEKDEEGNTIPVTVTAQQRLNAAVDICEYLERNNIIGTAASINVEDLQDIQLWYGTKFQVLLGDTTELSYKISCMKGFIDDYEKNRPYESGILDISDVNWIDYKSFS